MTTRRMRAAGVAGLVAAALLLSGCTVPRPEVTFYGNRTAVTAGAELWCEVNAKALTVACPATPDTSKDAHLTMAAGQPLQIDVPTDIGDTPWLVVFQYLDASGKAQSGRTEVFTSNELAYTLPPVGSGAQLTRVEVQSGLIPTQDVTGATSIAASRAWVLIVSPRLTPAASAQQ